MQSLVVPEVLGKPVRGNRMRRPQRVDEGDNKDVYSQQQQAWSSTTSCVRS